MPCLLILLAFFTPRLVMIVLYCFSHFIGKAFATTLFPLLGFFFMPYTTLAYAAAINWHGDVTGFYAAMVVLATLVDLGIVGSSLKPQISGL